MGNSPWPPRSIRTHRSTRLRPANFAIAIDKPEIVAVQELEIAIIRLQPHAWRERRRKNRRSRRRGKEMPLMNCCIFYAILLQCGRRVVIGSTSNETKCTGFLDLPLQLRHVVRKHGRRKCMPVIRRRYPHRVYILVLENPPEVFLRRRAPYAQYPLFFDPLGKKVRINIA